MNTSFSFQSLFCALFILVLGTEYQKFKKVKRNSSVISITIKKLQSQFFILYEQQPHLDNMHTVFGQVLDGWDTLDRWERLPVWGEKAESRSQKTTPLQPPEILGITIHANPLADDGITYPTPEGAPEKKMLQLGFLMNIRYTTIF